MKSATPIIDPSVKVLLILDSWGQGGTETYVAGLVKVLSRKNIKFNLVLLSGPAPAQLEGLPAGSISVLGYSQLLKRLRVERPEVLSLHLYTHLLPVTLLGRLFSIPIVTTLHMPYSAWGWRHRFYWRVATRLADMVVGVSNKIIDEINGKNVREKPISGGVDALFFKVKRTGVPRAFFDIAAVGRLGKEKDWPTLIGAVSRLPLQCRKKTRVHFYGDGSESNLLQTMAHEQGVRAVFHGHVGKKELLRGLAGACLSVLPSRFEGMPLSLLECMAAGVPMIISDFLKRKDQVIRHGLNGHVFPKGDVDRLGKLILWHLKNPGKSSNLGLAGKKFIREHFAEESVFLPYWNIWSLMIGRENFLEQNIFKVHELPTLMYHRVVDQEPPFSNANIHVSKENLEKQLRFLKTRGFEAIGFQDILARNLPAKPVILTFDDGYEDNYYNLFPLLKKYNMKAVIYILGDRKRKLNFWDAPKREPAVPLLKDWQIREMAQSPFVEFGSHSMSHSDLTVLDAGGIDREIRDSKSALEKFLRMPVVSFSFPYGRLNEELKKKVAGAGYVFGIGGDGPSRFGGDLMEIRREPMFPDTSSFQFWRKMSGYNFRYQELTKPLRKIFH